MMSQPSTLLLPLILNIIDEFESSSLGSFSVGLGMHNALKSTVNRKGQKRRIWLLPTQTLSYGEPKFIVILLPCHTTMLKSHIMKYFTFEINLLWEK